MTSRNQGAEILQLSQPRYPGGKKMLANQNADTINFH